MIAGPDRWCLHLFAGAMILFAGANIWSLDRCESFKVFETHSRIWFWHWRIKKNFIDSYRLHYIFLCLALNYMFTIVVHHKSLFWACRSDFHCVSMSFYICVHVCVFIYINIYCWYVYIILHMLHYMLILCLYFWFRFFWFYILLHLFKTIRVLNCVLCVYICFSTFKHISLNSGRFLSQLGALPHH